MESLSINKKLQIRCLIPKKYEIITFTLSNCSNLAIYQVRLLIKYNYQELNNYICISLSLDLYIKN